MFVNDLEIFSPEHLDMIIYPPVPKHEDYRISKCLSIDLNSHDYQRDITPRTAKEWRKIMDKAYDEGLSRHINFNRTEHTLRSSDSCRPVEKPSSRELKQLKRHYEYHAETQNTCNFDFLEYTRREKGINLSSDSLWNLTISNPNMSKRLFISHEMIRQFSETNP